MGSQLQAHEQQESDECSHVLPTPSFEEMGWTASSVHIGLFAIVSHISGIRKVSEMCVVQLLGPDP